MNRLAFARWRGKTHSAMAKILLAEDDDMTRDIVKTRLARAGHEVATVVNGAECVARAGAEAFDMIIMDLSMPVMDGWAAVRQLKAAPETRAVPVMALSAHSMERDRAKALAAGFDAFDSKPIHPQRFLDGVKALLDRPKA